MTQVKEKHGMGWLPDYPDFRDYTSAHKIIAPILKITKLDEQAKISNAVNLKEWCSPIENQGSIGSCTAHAGAGLIEYFEKRVFQRYINASRIFLYKVTRNMMHVTGDTGAFLRTTMGAMVLFGVPPEEYWPYLTNNFDVEPPSFCYAFAQNYQTIRYFRLDPAGTPRELLLNRIKTYLAAGIPSMFGFAVYNSISQAETTGKIPFPTTGEAHLGGHAIDAVGYDDTITIKNTNPGSEETTGAFLIRNSWGTEWGDAGYGWLPYKYVLSGLAVDWWVLIKNEWVNTEIFRA